MISFFYFSSLTAAIPNIHGLTLEEKVGQLFMVSFLGEEVNSDARQLIQEAHVGGFIYYTWANGLASPSQVQALSDGLQHLARGQRSGIPLLITVDQEGGCVVRLTKGFTVFPSSQAIGKTGNPLYAKACSIATGEELKAVGINMNLAPVIDVDTNSVTPVIGTRSYGSSPALVADFGAAALQGYRQSKVIGTLKHFPGYGAVSVDPHLDLPVVNKSCPELDVTDLYPFRILANEADAIMTGHLMLPQIDAKHCVTLSKLIVEGILRQEYKYEGVILSDSLVMEGVLNQCPNLEEAAVRALEAGHDMIILGGKLLDHKNPKDLTANEILNVFRYVVDAVCTGRLKEERIDASVERILQLKQKYQLFDETDHDFKSISSITMKEHLKLACDIANLSVQIVKNGLSSHFEIAQKRILLVAPTMLKDSIAQSALMGLGKEVKTAYFSPLNPSVEEQRTMLGSISAADVIVACSYQAWKNPEQVNLLQALSRSGKPVILIATRDPQDLACISEAAFTIATYSPDISSLNSAAFILQGKKTFVNEPVPEIRQ